MTLLLDSSQDLTTRDSLTVKAVQGLLVYFGAVNTIDRPGQNEPIGAPILVDGDYGDETRASVAAFQAANGLAQTGVVDAATSRALQDSSSNSIGGGGGFVSPLNGVAKWSPKKKFALAVAAAAAGTAYVKRDAIKKALTPKKAG